ncbi:MAG: four helix bundle protein [Acidobacteria bacterium]|nr:MAG: four helix bundle protein [Acidobacteriota bacterium]
MQFHRAMSFADDLEGRLSKFARATISFCRTLPCTDEAREWGGQLRRASTSASASYRASRRGKSKADWLNKIADTVEELDECDMWFSTLEASQLASPPQKLRSEARELRAILAKSLATGRANERRRKEQPKRGRKRDSTDRSDIAT